ncbi:S4 domain-containing protein [Neomegalonema sp.]|uniref:S4 domain-containing protein n=1 Tax=Neomegalonema sp. TaxID=2039713 RepID=UPI002636AFAA|nr:S4 domain-containing protein [Neomegalonema sp.]MDD2867632.1 S4 domain-containing protein [Neomegalonema sp.]
MSRNGRGGARGAPQEPAPGSAEEPGGARRLDKWLFAARWFRTRSAAAEAVASGAVRRNGVRCEKPGQTLQPGDVLTIRRARDVALIRVLAFAERRGGAGEAQALYQEIGSDHAEPDLASKDARA